MHTIQKMRRKQAMDRRVLAECSQSSDALFGQEVCFGHLSIKYLVHQMKLSVHQMKLSFRQVTLSKQHLNLFDYSVYRPISQSSLSIRPIHSASGHPLQILKSKIGPFSGLTRNPGCAEASKAIDTL